MRRKVLLDCDPGHDDAVAMMLAWGNPTIELLGVSTVGGNQTLDKVTRNALSVATVIGMHDVPIAAGCARPLVRSIDIAPDCHGDSGLDGVELPPAAMELDPRHGVDLIIDTIMSNEPGSDSRPHRTSHQYRDGGAQGAAHCGAGPGSCAHGWRLPRW